MTALEPTRLAAPATPVARRPWRRTHRRRRVRLLLVVTHRWLSLLLGLVLLVETMSGVALVYQAEIHRALNADAFHASGGRATTTLGQAAITVKREHPDFAVSLVTKAHGVYSVSDGETAWTVDPAGGRVLGHVGETPSWLDFLANLHECALTCEGYPGTLGWLSTEVPHTTWLGFDDAKVTVGGLVLGVLGVLLLYLSLSGLWLWFPRPWRSRGRWRQAVTVRRRKGRFARDTDLHKVVGVACLLPLLMWGVTGAGFELGPVEKAWYALTPGGGEAAVPDPPKGFGDGAPKGAPRITADQAAARAELAVPGAEVVYIGVPAQGDRATPYDVWLSSPHDPYGRTDYPGDIEVGVDQHSGATQVQYGVPGQSTSQWLWDAWNYPVHTGFVVGGWWRIPWVVLGLAPLLLAITGVSTWLVRRRSARDRRRAARERAAAAT